jgi:diguanylate cyclase (GGDEF)-like protein/PAS domain S-box-containing protein
MSLRILIPALLVIFSLLTTVIGYLAIYKDLTQSIEEDSLLYMNIELSKLQSLLTPMLTQKDIGAIKSLHVFKATELDNNAMVIVNEKGIITASNKQQDLLNPWQESQQRIQPELVQKTITFNQSHTQLSENRKLLNGYIDLCVRDLSKGLRNSSCGFLYYQIDVGLKQEEASSWLIKQSMYIAIGSGLAAILLMFILNILVTKRVLKIQTALDLWSKGDRNAKITLEGSDELSHIAKIINSLVKQFSEDEEALIFNQQVNNAIIHSANYSIIATDTKGIITTFNSSAEKLLGYESNELIDKQSPAIFHDEKEVSSYNKKLSNELNTSIPIGFETLIFKAKSGEADENNWTYTHKNGKKIPIRLSVNALYDSHGKIYGFLGIAYDISQQLEAEVKLEQLAYFDQLTQLPNRMLYTDRLNQAIAFSERYKTPFTILFMDLDKFKFVNDNYGHEVGDKLLIKVAEILVQCVRKSDTVARLGGDEFTIILPNINTPCGRDCVSAIAENIITELNQDIIIDNHLIQIGVSIGIAIYPEHGADASTLNKHADIAMYQAKSHGRGQYFFYDAKEDVTYQKDTQQEASP